ncbi:MAG: flagellar basal-body MS-ring/collar protein FliF [Candidatus Margulisiibacteriota bacterium]
MNNRILVILVGIVVLVAFLFLVFTFRGCIPSTKKDNGYTVIYSHLDLKDSANVVTRLKELSIPYELRDKGSAVAVPKEKSDDARLGLAEKNLPAGGDVGWEIFDETRMGTTDFDRRIQLIRAISGELSRTIRRIEGVEDARIQVVLPENRLFEVTKAPVTASVLIKTFPGFILNKEQVNGIVHLVSSSVENLLPENVMVVDDSGNILSTGAQTLPSRPFRPVKETIVERQIESVVDQEVITREENIASPEPQAVIVATQLTAEEKALMRLKAKDQYEKQLQQKIQDLLSVFYPPGTVNTRVMVNLGEAPKTSQRINKINIRTDSGIFAVPIQKISVMVLVDDQVELSKDTKKNTYSTIAEVIPYNKNRGDKITIKKVPFEAATAVIREGVSEEIVVSPTEKKKGLLSFLNWQIVLAIAALLIIVIVVIRGLRRRGSQIPLGVERGELVIDRNAPEVPQTIEQVREMAAQNPEKIAGLLKKWLTEEEG